MEKNTLIIMVDNQNDFHTGALANPSAVKIVEPTKLFLESMRDRAYVLATRDTHEANYMDTQEGKKLPVAHCIRGTWGWEVVDELKPYVQSYVDKKSFGYLNFMQDIMNIMMKEDTVFKQIILIGTCTDICVVSNALILKATFPEVKVVVMKDLCAPLMGDEKFQEAALTVMCNCQVEVI